MIEILGRGFLGSRADLLSDVLIVALGLIVPALVAALMAARRGNKRLHRTLMWTVVGVVVGYVVLYEAGMLAQGGMEFLRERIRMPEAPYFVVVALHVVVAVASLAAAALAVRKGTALFRRAESGVVDPRASSHRRLGYVAFALLFVSVVSGVGVYYLTFVYEALPTS